jgi:hypothetical protein
MLGNAFDRIETLVRNRTAVRRGMATLPDFCNTVLPSPVWKTLLRLDYENDVRRLAEWFRNLLTSEPPPAELNGFWFGLFNPIIRRRPTSCLYLTGSKRFDPQQSLPEWACGPAYFPEGRYSHSSVLATIYRAVNEAKEDVGGQGEYTLCLGYSCLAVAEWCRGPMRATLLGDAPLRAVAVGFDSGDALPVDVLRRDGVSSLGDVGEAAQALDEAGWLAGTDPEPMLALVRDKAGARKLRLFAAACCRRIWHLVRDERSHQAVEVAERMADGLSTEAEVEAARSAANEALTYSRGDVVTAEDHATIAAADALFPVAERAADSASSSVLSAAACDPDLGWFDDGREKESREQACLLRDIVGNPFRPQSPPGNRLTPKATALAQAIYDERRFADLPILADALEEAGFSDAELLDHLRGAGPHARGCWVLDLLMARE